MKGRRVNYSPNRSVRIVWGAVMALTLSVASHTQQNPPNERAGEPLDRPSNPNRPGAGEAGPGMFWVDFEESPLKEVVEAIGAKTGKNYFIDPSVGPQAVTVISHHPVPDEMAFEILEAILDAYGLAMFPTLEGNLVRISNRGTGTDKLEITTEGEAPMEGFDRFAIHIVPVQYTDASEVSELLQAVGSQNGQIRVYVRTNTLLLIDTINGIRNMLEVLEMVDVPGFEIVYEIFRLQYSRAELLAQQLMEVLQDDGSSGGLPGEGPAPASAAARIRAARAQAAGAPVGPDMAVVGGGASTLRIVPDERLNALVVVASQPMMEQVRGFIEELDVATPFDANNMHYLELLYADAEDVQEALDSLVSATSPRGGGEAPAPEEVQPFEREVFITPYDQNNALLVVASPQDFSVLKEMIDKLDRPRKQVNVQAIILAVSITDSVRWSVESVGLGQEDFFALSNVARIADAIVSPLGLAGAGGVFGILNGTTDISTVDPETGNTITREVANVPLLISAVEGLTDTEVLSQPNLLTQDNTEATMIVGQEVPVLNSLSDVDDRTGFQSRGNISRADVGVQLTVTPQINDGDMIRLEIKVEVSDTVASDVGVDPNELGPTFQKSQFTNEVVISNTQTGIIGGLIRENKSRSRSQTPVVGDLPVIGWMFRAKSNTRNKQNLVVMVTPRIVREASELDQITDTRLDEFYRYNKDVILEDLGFVKQQRKKNWKRDEYSPIGKYDDEANPASLYFLPEGKTKSDADLSDELPAVAPAPALEERTPEEAPE